MTEPTNHTESWATDSEDQPYTPERIAADWVQSATMVKSYLEADRADLARQWIDELDENLSAYAEGGAPPGSDEAASVYHDAVARAAIPYGQSPISVDALRDELAGMGMNVPPLDTNALRENTGITPLNAQWVAKVMDAAPAQQHDLPVGLEDVAAARLSVRRAIASITVNGESAQTHLTNANTALTQAINALHPEARLDVERAQESVQRANANVDLMTETAKQIDTEVTLYTLPDCVGCNATKRALNKAGVEYEEINLQERPELVEMFKQQGLAQAPIVETKEGERWAGYNPGKLREHGLDHRTRKQREGGAGTDQGHGR